MRKYLRFCLPILILIVFQVTIPCYADSTSQEPVASLPRQGAGATYYVDYENGDDVNDGLTPSTAWKHAPGAPEAAGNPNSVELQPGDTVLFKGGVIYRGSIDLLRVNGTADAPITYKGDGWGEERAIIEGSQLITTTWTRCESQAACGGNPHWENVYYTAAPEGKSFTSGFFQEDAFIWQSQDPNPDDPFYYDRTEYFRVIPIDDPTVFHARTSITDPRYFTQSDPTFWDGASVVVWHVPNVSTIHKVTGFDPDTHTVFHEDLGQDIYTDRDTFYAVLNHLHVLDRPGEYVLDENAGRFYVWPIGSDHPDQHAYSVLEHGTGIYGVESSYLVIEGFEVTKFSMGIRAIREPSSHVTIRNNRVSLLRSNDWYAVQASGEHMLVENNVVTGCQRAVGIMGGGSYITVQNNFVSRTSRQGIWFMGVEHGEILNNVVTDIRGTHSNGISVYLHHQDVLMAGNRVWDTNNAMTYHGNYDPDNVNNLIIFNNFFADGVHSWGKDMRGVKILNNTFLEGIFFPSDDHVVFFNNTIDNGGGGGDVRSHNVYIGLTWSQQPRYGWSPGPGEIVDWNPDTEQYVPIDPVTILIHPDADYHLRPASPAIDAGIDVTPYLPAPGEFPHADLSIDLDGKKRPQGTAWDMGACEFVPPLVLHGTPLDRAIGLTWEFTGTLPTSTTWRISYVDQNNSTVVPEPGLISTTNAYTITGLTNGLWYTVTLNGMLDGAPFLTDTVHVMPQGGELVLRATPGDGIAYLDWHLLREMMPATGTWRIGYESDTGTALFPAVEIPTSTVRSHTLVGLTNGVWYTVTLNAMVDASPWLTDTVRVMPTDRLIYLPLVLRG